jgi:hypothetical protein
MLSLVGWHFCLICGSICLLGMDFHLTIYVGVSGKEVKKILARKAELEKKKTKKKKK